MAFRAHFMMSVWNFQRMLHIGFINALLPIRHDLHYSPEDLNDFLKRHLHFFNTHPYFASLILGVIARKEEIMAGSPPEERAKLAENIDTLKRSFMGPMGALGDSFFWETVRPFLAIAIMLFIILRLPDIYLTSFGLLIYLLLYNLLHEYIRFYGVFLGYYKSEEVIRHLYQLNIPKINDRLKDIGMIFAGMLAGAFCFQYYLEPAIPEHKTLIVISLKIAVFLPLIILYWYLIRKKLSTSRLLLVSLFILGVADLIWMYVKG